MGGLDAYVPHAANAPDGGIAGGMLLGGDCRLDGVLREQRKLHAALASDCFHRSSTCQHIGESVIENSIAAAV
jgi:hypothetical protein